MPRFEAEPASRAIVEEDPGAVRDFAASEGRREARDVADDVPVAVRDGERRRLADLFPDRARRDRILRAGGIDPAALLAGVRLAEEPGEGVRDEPRVPDVGKAVRERQLLGLHHQVDRLRRPPGLRSKVVVLEDVEHLEQHEPL